MLGEDFVSSVKKYASKNSEDNEIHGFLHVERVFNLCFRLGKIMNTNLIILEISALLHDIGRKLK
ncbi:MAG: HD domain-containing protein [Promethearchaeota archaeon]